METSKIRELLARYYNGETSEEEENELLRFFKDCNIPEDLKDERQFFIGLHVPTAETDINDRLVRRLKTMIDNLDNPTANRPPQRHRRTFRLRTACGIAASILAVASLGIYLHSRENSAPQISRTDHIALVQAQDALVKFSTTLNKGLEQMEEAQKKTENIGEKINKCLN